MNSGAACSSGFFKTTFYTFFASLPIASLYACIIFLYQRIFMRSISRMLIENMLFLNFQKIPKYVEPIYGYGQKLVYSINFILYKILIS
jgi:hypothetical protein